MAFVIQDELMGMQAIAEIALAPRHPIGMIVHAVSNESVIGGGEFVYGQAAAPITVGQVCRVQASATVPAPAAANYGRAVGVAMVNLQAGQAGWFQITGRARVAKTNAGIADDTPVMISGTAGSVIAVATPAAPAVAGQLTGAASTAGGALAADPTVVVQLSRPTIV